MRTTASAALIAATALPLLFLAAAPASAAPGDVVAVFTTTPNPGVPDSNTVTGTFTSADPAGIFLSNVCEMQTSDGEIRGFGYRDESNNTVTTIDPDVPDGTYVIDWICISGGGFVRPDDSDGTTGYTFPPYVGTREPTTLVVPAVVPEDPELPGCTGSVCLPTGSFGF